MDTHVTEWIYRLVDFAIAKEMIEAQDRAFYVNRLLEAMRMDAPEEINYAPVPAPETAPEMLDALTGAAAAQGIIEDSGENRDLFSAKLMGLLTPEPQRVRERFFALYRENGPAAATEWFYKLCRDCDYIKVDRIAKNMRFFEDTEAGKLEITINLSKPEKDPRDIAAQRSAKQTGYPKCMLCPENPGYAGHIGFPARQNHRIIPLTLGGKSWYMQYSPYLYYNEHCIVFNAEHVPMRISRDTFVRLCDFVDQFPHYMLGSNADLPIVGGSILSHDHFQGGNYHFPMDSAGVRIALASPDPAVEALSCDFGAKGYAVCVVSAGGEHGNLTADYAAIPAEMKAVAQAMGVNTLSEITSRQLMDAVPSLKNRVSDRAILRAFHFVDETERVTEAVEAICRDDIPAFFRAVVASGESSWMLLQNLYVASSSNQEMPLALELSRRMLEGRGAWRIHGGGFAGTILAFVPFDLLDEYSARMNAVFGERATTALAIRPEGVVCIR